MARRDSPDLPPSVMREVLAREAAPEENGTKSVAADPDAERRKWSPSPGCRIIACVDVQPVVGSDIEPVRPDVLWGLTIKRMERCIRPGDWMCMLGGPRLAVCLGSGAHRVSPSALGRRLARAMGGHLAVGTSEFDLQVAVGIGAGANEVDPASLTAAAMASIRTTRGRVATCGSDPASPFVAVSHIPTHASDQPNRLPRRVLVAVGDEESDSPYRTVPARRTMGSSRDHVRLTPAPAARIVLVDPFCQPPEPPRPVVEAVANIARRFGARPIMCPAGDPESVLLNLYVTEPDAVIMVLQSELPRRGGTPDPMSPWERLAMLTRALRQAEVPVIAISMGASAAALAVCVEQGAAGIFHPDLLPQELARVSAGRSGGANGSSAGYDDMKGPGQLPAPYDALVHLTPSERKVLYLMMEGRAAAEIAATLVVSLTTVRSHIRSILRKLNVNSQLAAVALAFGTLADEATAG